jgi:hypothetical protein
MLYLDQPVQVGMSYDTLTNITTNTDTGAVKVANFSSGVPTQNASLAHTQARMPTLPHVVPRTQHELFGTLRKCGSKSFPK